MAFPARTGLELILPIEDDPAVASLACPDTGVLAWPAIRNVVLRLILSDRLYQSRGLVPSTPPERAGALVVNAARSTLRDLGHAARPAPVAIIGTGAGLLEVGGASFNRITDHLAAELGSGAWTFEHLAEDRWPAAPRANPRVSFLADQRLASAVRGRLGVRSVHRRLAADLVHVVEARAATTLDWQLGEARRRWLLDSTARRISLYPWRARATERLLARSRARTVLLEEGCFGDNAVFNVTARGLGVAVAEIQHGMVTTGHDAYNVAPSLATSAAYRATMPAVFLSYGEWWHGQFNAPVERRLVIGYPHRTERLAGWRSEPVDGSVLVLGDGVDTALTLAFAARLAELAPGSTVAIRPHPRERQALARLAGAGEAAVRVDDLPDLYDALARTETVVGETSTGLFEAIGLVPRVFAWDTPKSRLSLAAHPFASVASPEALAQALADPTGGRPPEGLGEGLWAPGWRARLRAFVESWS